MLLELQPHFFVANIGHIWSGDEYYKDW